MELCTNISSRRVNLAKDILIEEYCRGFHATAEAIGECSFIQILENVKWTHTPVTSCMQTVIKTVVDVGKSSVSVHINQWKETAKYFLILQEVKKISEF